MNKYFNLANVVIILFIVTTIGDVVSTVMAANKHTIEIESSPLNVWGLPLWLFMVIKLVIYSVLLLLCTKWYHFSKVYWRYYLILFFVLMIIIQAAVTVSNFEIYNEPKGTVEPIPKEERIQAYMEGVGDMKVIQTIDPTPKGFKIPSMIYLLLFNMFTFIIWLSFEKKYNMYGVK